MCNYEHWMQWVLVSRLHSPGFSLYASLKCLSVRPGRQSHDQRVGLAYHDSLVPVLKKTDLPIVGLLGCNAVLFSSLLQRHWFAKYMGKYLAKSRFMH